MANTYPLSWRSEICSQQDFIKVIVRFQVYHQAFMIYGRLLSRKIYIFAAFHLTPNTEEPESLLCLLDLRDPRQWFLFYHYIFNALHSVKKMPVCKYFL